MNKVEAEDLERQISGEPGWHTSLEHNTWSGEWYVRAWQGEGEEAEENCYVLRYRAAWYKLRKGLAEEAREQQFMDEWIAKRMAQGYSREAAAEEAVWELHVRSGGD